MIQKLTDKAAALEAVLFACGDPVEPERLAAAAGVEKGALAQLADSLEEFYIQTGSGLTVLKLSGCYQLATRAEYEENVKAAAETRRNTPLSPAAMEALTIIAYNQPVTKSFVEHIRGVDSSGVVNSLAERDLVEEAGRLDVPGRPIAYRTTANFLRCFGLESLEDLPPLPGHVPEDFDSLLTPGSEVAGDSDDSGEFENLGLAESDGILGRAMDLQASGAGGRSEKSGDTNSVAVSNELGSFDNFEAVRNGGNSDNSENNGVDENGGETEKSADNEAGENGGKPEKFADNEADEKVGNADIAGLLSEPLKPDESGGDSS
ncbi:MAG: SMC-Scp complex subunit ScpB [Oscillospiraceae bacterium]|nr:SMC-Scp complex subunit ScpB [Oscillospiraceae bacterium]